MVLLDDFFRESVERGDAMQDFCIILFEDFIVLEVFMILKT